MAAQININVAIDTAAVNALTGRTSTSAVNQAARIVAKRVRDNIVSANLIDTGFMRDNIDIEYQQGPARNPIARVHVRAPHAIYQEYGTRAHGPVRAQYLRFKPKGKSFYVFAKWVRGVPAQRFMQRAVDSLTAQDFIP